MKKIYYITAAFAFLSLTGCGDGIDLPDINVETDLNKIPLPDNETNLIQVPLKPETEPMDHRGFHTEEDFERIRTHLEVEPWKTGYGLLVASNFSQKTAGTSPTKYIVRGDTQIIDGEEHRSNYEKAFRATATVYQQALRWRIEGDDAYAEKAVENINAWVKECIGIVGGSNQSLAAGLYGYQFAIAGELLRDFKGWKAEDFRAFQDWMIKVFNSQNDDFLNRFHGANPLHYWANWCLCNIASKMAIGIVTDQRKIYNEGICHLQEGVTNGRFRRAIYHDYAPEHNFAQWQESGRDQGHTLMCVGLMGMICQLAWSQGDDFFAYDSNLFLRACEYAACCYYTDESVPYTTYIWQKQSPWGYPIPEVQSVLGGGKGLKRAVWALPYYHYKIEKEVTEDLLKYTKTATDFVGNEGGGGYYEANSGGFDVLGFGTLMFARE